MPTRILNPDHLTPGTIAVFEAIRSGEWVAIDDVVDIAAPFCVEHERETTLKNGRRVRRKVIASGKNVDEDELLRSGSRDLIRNRLMIAERSGRIERTRTALRMLPATVAEWDQVRTQIPAGLLLTEPLLFVEPQPATATRVGSSATTVEKSTPADDADRTEATVTPLRASRGTSRAAEANQARPVTPDEPAQDATADEHDFTWDPDVSGGRVCTGLADHSGWADAPLLEFDSVHFRVKYRGLDDQDLAALVQALPADCIVTHDKVDDLYRAECPVGSGPMAREAIREWFDVRDWEISQLRAENKPTRRRLISDLDPLWLSGLSEHANRYVQRITFQKHKAVLNQHFTDRSDIESLGGLWVVQAIMIFDHEKSVPFGAFLNSKLSQWINDLNRKGYGRQATDDERNLRRAERAFIETHSRQPTEAELAEALGTDTDWIRKTRGVIAQMQNRRYWISLDSGDADHETDFGAQIHDEETAETHVLDLDMRAEISRSLLAACAAEGDPARRRGRGHKGPNILGFISFYERFWGEGVTKKDLAETLGTTNKNMNAHAERVAQRLSAEATHLIES